MKYIKFFLSILMTSISPNLYSQTMITGNVINEDSKPFTDYTLRAVGVSKQDSLHLYSPNGAFSFEGKDCPYHFTITYFGEQVLDTIVGCDDLKSHLTFQARMGKQLEEVIVKARRPIVKSKLMEDQIQVNGIKIFENDNVAEILQKIPGSVQSSSQLKYKSLPVVSVRFGRQGMSRPLTADILQMLESQFAENVSSLTFKRLPQGNSYELIVNSVVIKGFETANTAEYSRGKGDYGMLNTRNVFNTEKLSNSIYLRTMPSRSPKSSTKQYVFDDGDVKNIADDIEQKKNNFYGDYSNNYSLSKQVNVGLLINYFVKNDKDDRTSNVYGDISDRDGAQVNHFFTTGVYFDLNKKKHQLHLEMAFNNMNDRYKLRDVNNALIQHTKSNNISPNASADYTYTFRNPKFKLRSLSAYSYMLLKSEDVLSNTKFDDYWEHIFNQNLYLNGSFGNFEFNAGVTLDYSNNVNDHCVYLDPHILLDYKIKGHNFSLRYDQKTSRPLSGNLSTVTKQKNDGVEIIGNSDLKPYRNSEFGLSYSKGNFGLTVGGIRRDNWWILIPSYKDNKFIYQYTNVGTSHMFTASVYYSQYWKYFYLSPYISFETGKFKIKENNAKRDNRYLDISLPMGFTYRKHRLNMTFSYTPISQFEVTKEEPKSNLSIRYTYSAFNNALRISLFAKDIFKQNQIQSTMYADGFNEYRDSHTDSRRFGIQLVYRFKKNKVKNFSSLRHNVTRN